MPQTPYERLVEIAFAELMKGAAVDFWKISKNTNFEQTSLQLLVDVAANGASAFAATMAKKSAPPPITLKPQERVLSPYEVKILLDAYCAKKPTSIEPLAPLFEPTIRRLESEGWIRVEVFKGNWKFAATAKLIVWVETLRG